jgi:hypothetical protein
LEDLDYERIELVHTRVVESPTGVSHLRYRVVAPRR